MAQRQLLFTLAKFRFALQEGNFAPQLVYARPLKRQIPGLGQRLRPLQGLQGAIRLAHDAQAGRYADQGAAEGAIIGRTVDSRLKCLDRAVGLAGIAQDIPGQAFEFKADFRSRGDCRAAFGGGKGIVMVESIRQGNAGDEIGRRRAVVAGFIKMGSMEQPVAFTKPGGGVGM
jgi:hypothetical protein